MALPELLHAQFGIHHRLENFENLFSKKGEKVFQLLHAYFCQWILTATFNTWPWKSWQSLLDLFMLLTQISTSLPKWTRSMEKNPIQNVKAKFKLDWYIGSKLSGELCTNRLSGNLLLPWKHQKSDGFKLHVYHITRDLQGNAPALLGLIVIYIRSKYVEYFLRALK